MQLKQLNTPSSSRLNTLRVERSSDQVIKPVNLEALSKWVGNIPDDVVRDMADIAPMLSVLGYDPYANPPDYGKPDSSVKDNTFKVGRVVGEGGWVNGIKGGVLKRLMRDVQRVHTVRNLVSNVLIESLYH